MILNEYNNIKHLSIISTSDINLNKSFIGYKKSAVYFPIYSLFSYFENDLYYKPAKPSSIYKSKISYDDVLYKLHSTICLGSTVNMFKYENEDYPIYSQLGYLWTEDHTLLMLTTNDPENTFTPDGKDVYYDKLRLYISTEFMTDIIYKNIYARINKEYIQECFEKGVEIIYTTSEKIDKYIFTNPYVKNIVDIPTLMENINEEGFNLLTFVPPVETTEEVIEELPF